jgi:hypothetical protein
MRTKLNDEVSVFWASLLLCVLSVSVSSNLIGSRKKVVAVSFRKPLQEVTRNNELSEVYRKRGAIMVFADFYCFPCRAKLTQLMKQSGKYPILVRHYPFTSNRSQSKDSAILCEIVPESKRNKFIEVVLSDASLSREDLIKNLTKSGLISGVPSDSSLAMGVSIMRSDIRLASELQVTSTPYLFFVTPPGILKRITFDEAMKIQNSD